MGEKFEGEVVEVNYNFGVIKSLIKDHQVYVFFFVYPDMIKNESLEMTKNVHFRIKNIEVRKSRVYIAYDLENIENTELCVWGNLKQSKDKKLIFNHYDYLFKDMMENDDNISSKNLEVLKQCDKKTKELFLKWILYLESTIKEVLSSLLSSLNVSSVTLYRILKANGRTKNIVDKQFKNIKLDFMFKTEFCAIKIKRSENDPSDIVVTDCPFSLFLENLSLNDLGAVLNQILAKIDLSNSDNSEKYKYLYLIKESFLELAFIRNCSAHGNPLIPKILDQNFSANFFYDMASVFPSWNSKDSVEDWELFDFIRFTARSLFKQGLPLVNASGPQLSALAFTKSLLINPAKRSYFMFFFVALCTFEYVSSNRENDFWRETSFFIFNILSDNTEENYLNHFPNDDHSVKQQLTKLILPLISYRTVEHGGQFKAILESTIKIPQKNYTV